MPNIDSPNGFTPVYNIYGGEMGRTIPYKVVASGTIYKNAAVSAIAAGTVQESAANDGAIVAGVAAEYKVGNSDGTTEIAVYPAWMYAFVIQSASDTDVAATDVHATANHVAGAGDATTKMSGHELDASDIGSGLQLRILDKFNVPGNNWGEDHVDLIVAFNECFAPGSGAATI